MAKKDGRTFTYTSELNEIERDVPSCPLTALCDDACVAANWTTCRIPSHTPGKCVCTLRGVYFSFNPRPSREGENSSKDYGENMISHDQMKNILQRNGEERRPNLQLTQVS